MEDKKTSDVLEGVVVQLDRGFPLVRSGELFMRCKHATHLVKHDDTRATIGDRVVFEPLEGAQEGLILKILPRKNAFVRKDPAERSQKQILAANFDIVLIVEPVLDYNERRVERACVLAFESGASVAVVLTKTDLAEQSGETANAYKENIIRAFLDVDVFTTSIADNTGIDAVRADIGNKRAVVLGKSGAGKSSLVNALAQKAVQEVGEVRQRDNKGRHTTVARKIIDLPGGGSVVDIPGIRGLALWDNSRGIEAVFSDIEELSQQCKFRDCSHTLEPGCAVLSAIGNGLLSNQRLEVYIRLKKEVQAVRATNARQKWRS